MIIYDISIPIQRCMPIWPGDPLPQSQMLTSIERGDTTNTTQIHSSVHIGTHVDAPRHILSSGRGVDKLSLDVLVGTVEVIEFAGVNQISKSVLNSILWPIAQRILFKTKNSKLWGEGSRVFHPDFVSLTPDGAEFLLEMGVQLVGIDYLSVDLYKNRTLPVHRTLLTNDVVVIEGLNLSGVPPGTYELYCLPLKIVDADGAPARVILKKL